MDEWSDSYNSQICEYALYVNTIITVLIEASLSLWQYSHNVL